MAAQPDISSILAALAAQRPAGQSQTPQQSAPPPQPVPGMPPGYPALTNPTPPAGLPGFNLPQPSGSGSLDLSSIRPVNTGSVSIADAIAKARGFAAEKGYDSGRASSITSRDDPRTASRQQYRRSRSRSRTPPRRDNYRDSYNPYRDERRADRRSGGGGGGGGGGSSTYGRDRSRSPGPRGRDTFSPNRQYARDRTPDNSPDNEIIVIDSALVGLVIGRQGENLKRIETETKTRIQFISGPENSGPRRHCRITGNTRARVEAKREINRIIEENGGNPPQDMNAGTRANLAMANRGRQQQNERSVTPVLKEGENSLQIMVPDKTVGLIIGRGGETIRDLQERSGCHVNIVGENKSINGLRPVNLIGTPQAADKAKHLILEIVESDTRNPNGQQQQPQQQQFTTNQARGGGGLDFGGFNQGASDKINETIHVPSEAVGMIIGKGGETIKDMQNTTGCKINVTQPSGADIEREIGLIGTRQAIEQAKTAIWDKVETVQQRERDGGGRGGGNRGGRGGRSNNNDDSYGDRYSQQQPSYGQSQVMMPNTATGSAPAGADAAGADPYAAYGGYQNYVAMWYAAIAQQQGSQGQPGQGSAPA
ncbi:eukaryotic type KH-domain (KH-domain type I) [Pseudovirgaria hyperparasitica]|uniref:Eukaryotic type KH-domain (KH-domain type I) n=1 Tax=Pseudovirgaria hyperparasitica TaxID=470096 RepID=A0A6A6VUH6_9PEZI|nr:eukaryotic type KH-domain (KH-domain type I) [Pseudovirgaria hyperparasitica]KAF2752901.1 eukaryotic type KH-domain (KH-domain type I) [Pseudovirgaria hyperparasitica]